MRILLCLLMLLGLLSISSCELFWNDDGFSEAYDTAD
jgi:hypothetical protein